MPLSYGSSSCAHHPETFLLRNSSNHKNCNIKFPLNTFSDQIVICLISFGNLWRQTNLFSNEKVNIWPTSRYFPFLLHFFVEMKRTQNLQYKKTGERWKTVKPLTLQINFLEVTGNRNSYHYARNIYIKVFL